MSEIEITEVRDVDDELVEAFARLLPQLSTSSPLPGAQALQEIVDAPATTLLVARDPLQEGAIVGCLTLVLFRIPTSLRAWIEDVVVDGRARGRGVGAALTRAAVERARAAGAANVNLTTRPSREAANRLYRRLGFEIRETNAYRYRL